MNKRVVVTGYGIVSPVGIGADHFWDALINGRSGIDLITQFDAANFDARIAGEVRDFTPPSFLTNPKDLRRNARFVLFALKAMEEAVKHSGIDIKTMDPYRAGVIVGSGIGSLEVVEEEHSTYLQRGPKKMSPFMIPMMITNEAAGNIAIHTGFKGVNYCTVTACASGAHAIGESFRAIKHGYADVIITGGTEACITPVGVGGFCALRALSVRNDQPKQASRPFDKDRNGFVMAEGAGILILEELEHAKKRGAKILGEVCGYGATCDAFHITAPHPEGEAASHGIELCLKEAQASISEKVYINAHGTSTELNDKIETKAIKRVYGAHAKDLIISSTKSMTGHMLGATGAVEFIVSCLAVKNKVIPPTINLDNPDSECDLNYVPHTAIKVPDLKFSISNSLGFGGHNVTLAVREYR